MGLSPMASHHHTRATNSRRGVRLGVSPTMRNEGGYATLQSEPAGFASYALAGCAAFTSSDGIGG